MLQCLQKAWHFRRSKPKPFFHLERNVTTNVCMHYACWITRQHCPHWTEDIQYQSNMPRALGFGLRRYTFLWHVKVLVQLKTINAFLSCKHPVRLHTSWVLLQTRNLPCPYAAIFTMAFQCQHVITNATANFIHALMLCISGGPWYDNVF